MNKTLSAQHKNHIFVWLFAVGVVLVLVLVTAVQVPLARAQSDDVACTPPGYTPIRTIELTPRISETASTSIPRVFFSTVVSVTLEGGERICLASSPDGRGELKVDDLITLQVTHSDGSQSGWTHNFYDPRTGGISTSPAQDVSRIFAPRLNSVLVFLSDLKPQFNSAMGIYLIVWQGISFTPSLTNPAGTLTRTATTAATPTATSLVLGPISSQTPTAVAGTANPVSSTPTPVPPQPNIESDLQWLIPVLVVLVIVMALVLLFVFWQERRQVLEKNRQIEDLRRNLDVLKQEQSNWKQLARSNATPPIQNEIGQAEELLKQAQQDLQNPQTAPLADEKATRALDLLGKHEVKAGQDISDLSRDGLLVKIASQGDSLDRKRTIIYEYVPRGTRGQLRGYAEALKEDWARRSRQKDIIDEIYELLKRGCSPQFFCFLADPIVPKKVRAGTDERKNVRLVQRIGATLCKDMTDPSGPTYQLNMSKIEQEKKQFDEPQRKG